VAYSISYTDAAIAVANAALWIGEILTGIPGLANYQPVFVFIQAALQRPRWVVILCLFFGTLNPPKTGINYRESASTLRKICGDIPAMRSELSATIGPGGIDR
jgi:hypothetical protein